MSRTLMDGDVRVVAEGAEPELLKFMDALRGSHVYRYVRKEQVAWSAATGEFAGFDVRYA
jgi:acylphosphatase